MRTITEKYYAVQEGKFSKTQFLRDAQRELPHLISKFNGFEDSVQILKSKGILAEAKKQEPANPNKFSAEALERGIDRELEAMGLDSVEAPSAEDYNKAQAKALKNLTKDPNHYLNLLSGESKKVDKHDKEVEVKRGKEEKDVFNGMKKAALKENKQQLLESLAAIVAQAKAYAGEKWPELSDDDVMDFVKIHGKELLAGDDLETSFDNFVYHNFDLEETRLKEAIKNIIRKTLTEETVEEINKDSYERIDGLTNLRLLDQLLNTAAAIYNDQIESGDLFDAQDVAEYLANKIYDKISKIEAAPEMEESAETVKEDTFGADGYTIIELIKDRSRNNDSSEIDEAMEVMEFIGEHYGIAFEYGRFGHDI